MQTWIEASFNGIDHSHTGLLLGQLDTSTIGFDPNLIFSGTINLLVALAWLIGGWIVALILSAIAQGALKRTKLDNQIAAWMVGDSQTAKPIPVEKWVATAVFWIVMVFAVVAFLDALNLEVVSQPLNSFLQEITLYAPRLLGAGIIAGVAWVLATVVRLAITQSMKRFQFEERLAEQLSEGQEQGVIPLSETLGNVIYWFILLFFLPFILGTLQLEGPLEPVQNLLNDFLAALPQIVKAAVIAAVGWGIARLVRVIVTNFLRAAGSDQLGERFGLAQATGSDGISLSGLAGTLAYGLVLILTAITALNELRIEAISEPAIALLNDVVAAIPLILKAGLILVVAYVIS
ncbi:MAG: mechanosensitive ion channel, partial [Cyanobacteria bacterium P01_H01_bin.121]